MKSQGPKLEVRPDLNPMRIKIRKPDLEEHHESNVQDSRIRKISGLILASFLVVSPALLATKCSEDSSNTKAAEAGAQARAELNSALPDNSNLPPEFVKELKCIASRAGQACQNTQRSDKFEKDNCDSTRLDEWEGSEGANKQTTSLSLNAQYLVEPWGIKPELKCEGNGENRRLSIKINKTVD